VEPDAVELNRRLFHPVDLARFPVAERRSLCWSARQGARPISARIPPARTSSAGTAGSGADAQALREIMRQAAIAGGDIAMASFRPGQQTSARVRYKTGNSPVSDADEAVDAFLKETLTAALPSAGWLSEETRDDRVRLDHDLCWVVDPIDGTRAYCAGDSNWTVAIALVEKGRPLAGVVHAPALGEHYSAVRGAGAEMNGAPILASPREQALGARVAGPGPMVDKLEHYTGALTKMPRLPSLALRLARVASNDLDIALVSAHARDWDIAAADLLIEEAGGLLTGLDGFRPVYNLRDPQHETLISSGAPLHGEVLEGVQDFMRRNGWT